MKKAAILGLAFGSVVLVGGAGAFIYSLPYLTVSNIIKGIVENDAEILDDNIDFPRLKSNLKNNVQTAIRETVAQQSSSNNPWEMLGQQFAEGFFSSMANAMIDKTITPTALGSIPIEGKKKGFLYYVPGTTSGYESLSKFRVSKRNEFAQTNLILSRRGLHWELTNVTISDIDTDAITRNIQDSLREEMEQYASNSETYRSAAPSPTPKYSPKPEPEPASTPQTQYRSDAADFVASYYSNLNNGNYESSWNGLSANFSSSLSYSDYTDWWNSVSEIQVGNVSTLSQSGSSARVKADITYVMNDGRVVKDKKPFINLVWDD